VYQQILVATSSNIHSMKVSKHEGVSVCISEYLWLRENGIVYECMHGSVDAYVSVQE
jgi:hypothetical protein